jgi:hypothetical protein
VRQQRLVDNTLKKYQASVEVKFEVNAVPHLVRRRSGSGDILLRIGDGELQSCTKEEVRTLPRFKLTAKGSSVKLAIAWMS